MIIGFKTLDMERTLHVSAFSYFSKPEFQRFRHEAFRILHSLGDTVLFQIL